MPGSYPAKTKSLVPNKELLQTPFSVVAWKKSFKKVLFSLMARPVHLFVHILEKRYSISTKQSSEGRINLFQLLVLICLTEMQEGR